MQDNLKFKLPDGHKERQFIRGLAEQYTLKKLPAVVERYTICDTFDWRLFNKSFVLYGSENRLFLRRLAEDEILHSAEITAFPVFIWNFPDSDLKIRLAPIIEMRALLRLVEVQCRSVTYRILNAKKKTVAQLAYQEFRSGSRKVTSPFVTKIWLKPVRGYPKYRRTLFKQFQDAGLKINKLEEVYFKALEGVDKKPGDYSAIATIQLNPEMRSDQAAKVILRFLLQVMRNNEAHIGADLDTEFLHDFRVAVRRTRSALGQLKYVFPAKTTDRFMKDFALIGKLTNELRDLDVYLLNEDKYKAMLPSILRDDIDPLLGYLRKKRAKALQKVIRGLKTNKYFRIMNDWEAFLNTPQGDSTTASNAMLPVTDLARSRIHKKFRDAVKAGGQIRENPEDEMLHALRIHCKKLRYLMEFFSSLFTAKKLNKLIRQLKKLQDDLGYYNDLRVQREYLLSIVEELPASQQQPKKTIAAIGSLVGCLDSEKQSVKDEFQKAFTDFTSPANHELFEELFGSAAKRHVDDHTGDLQ